MSSPLITGLAAITPQGHLAARPFHPGMAILEWVKSYWEITLGIGIGISTKGLNTRGGIIILGRAENLE